MKEGKRYSVEWGGWRGVYEDTEGFCIDCFMRFLPLTEEEIDFAGKQESFQRTPLTEKYIQKELPKDKVNFGSDASDVMKDIPKSSARHPLCPIHRKGFFEIEKCSTDRESHNAHYKHIFHRMENKLLSDIALEDDADIVGYAAPIRKLFHTFASNALVHNPAAYLYPKNNILFTCSGYDADPSISERKAIMEGIERFSAFSPIDPYNSLILNGSLSHDTPGPSIPLHPELYSEYDGDNISEILAYNTAKNSCESLPIEHFFLIDKKKYKPSLNYLNSIGCAAHLSPILAANSALLELIERDALMRLWFFRYIPQAYTVDDIMKGLNMDTSMLNLKDYTLKVLKLKTHDHFVTLSLMLGKDEKIKPYYFFGNGCDTDEYRSIKKSLIELISNFQNNYLYDFAKKDIDISEVNDPGDHYMYYAEYGRFKDLDFLLSDQNEKSEVPKEGALPGNPELIVGDYFVVDITPQFLYRKGISVIRAYSPILQNMYFGLRTLRIIPTIDLSTISPSVFTQPHPFS